MTSAEIEVIEKFGVLPDQLLQDRARSHLIEDGVEGREVLRRFLGILDAVRRDIVRCIHRDRVPAARTVPRPASDLGEADGALGDVFTGLSGVGSSEIAAVDEAHGDGHVLDLVVFVRVVVSFEHLRTLYPLRALHDDVVREALTPPSGHRGVPEVVQLHPVAVDPRLSGHVLDRLPNAIRAERAVSVLVVPLLVDQRGLGVVRAGMVSAEVADDVRTGERQRSGPLCALHVGVLVDVDDGDVTPQIDVFYAEAGYRGGSPTGVCIQGCSRFPAGVALFQHRVDLVLTEQLFRVGAVRVLLREGDLRVPLPVIPPEVGPSSRLVLVDGSDGETALLFELFDDEAVPVGLIHLREGSVGPLGREPEVFDAGRHRVPLNVGVRLQMHEVVLDALAVCLQDVGLFQQSFLPGEAVIEPFGIVSVHHYFTTPPSTRGSASPRSRELVTPAPQDRVGDKCSGSFRFMTGSHRHSNHSLKNPRGEKAAQSADLAPDTAAQVWHPRLKTSGSAEGGVSA